MTCFQTILSIINIVAVIAAPIVAVWIGQSLQDRTQKRKDKMEIFKTLMANRTGWSPNSVYALNVIDIVFSDDAKVRACWKEYYEKLCVQNPNEMQIKQIQTAQYKLLEAMAVSLGYKDQITWETIQNPYIPIGMTQAITQQQALQAGQGKAIEMILAHFTANAYGNADSSQKVPDNTNT